MDERGYQVLSDAATPEAVAAYASERAAAGDGLLVRAPGAEHVELMSRAAPDAGAVDPYAILDAARRVLLPEAVTTALTERFGGDAPLLFDAVESAAAAPEPGPYRDATYTALADDPDTLVTVIVALEAATVTVWPGSQSVETSPFSGRYRHFNPERDGAEAIDRHRAELTGALSEEERVELPAGAALVLDAGLVHRAPEGPALVAHLVPVRVRPGYFAYRPERARHASIDDGRAFLASQHYDLIDAVAPEDPPTQEEELERVEEALRAHDAENVPQTPPPPGAPRRSGGLVDSVRGMLGRRNRG